MYSDDYQRDALQEVLKMVAITKNDLKAGALRVAGRRFGRPNDEVFPINRFLSDRGVDPRGFEDPTQR